MKLLMTCDAVGGVWQYATDLAQALAGEGVEVVLAVLGPSSLSPSGERVPSAAKAGEGQCNAASVSHCPSPDLAFGLAILSPEGEREGGVTVIHTGLPLDWLATGAEEVRHTAAILATIAAEHGCDLIHLNSPTLATAAYPAPVVAVAHGCVGTWFAALGETPDPSYAWHGEMMRAGLFAADATVAPSAAFAATLQRRYALPTAPIAIHNGRTPLSLPDAESSDHVFTAGRLWDRVKNTALLDQVAALLPVPLRAAGPTTAPHGETATPANLHLLGVLPEAGLAAELARQPIFVSAARFEPFGLAVLEAAQAGCPLILSGIDTFRELWTGAALIVPDETPEAYAAAIARVRTEPGLREHLSEAARTRAARYTPQATATAMLGIYRSLLTGARVAA